MSEENKTKIIIDAEIAVAEFQRFCDAWEIDNDESAMKEDDKIDFSKLKNQITKAIRKGRLCLNQDETLSYTVSEKSGDKKKGQVLIIKRPKGDSYLAMDRYKEGQGVHKFNAILGNMTNHAPEFFSDFDGIDLKPLQAIVSLFLAE